MIREDGFSGKWIPGCRDSSYTLQLCDFFFLGLIGKPLWRFLCRRQHGGGCIIIPYSTGCGERGEYFAWFLVFLSSTVGQSINNCLWYPFGVVVACEYSVLDDWAMGIVYCIFWFVKLGFTDYCRSSERNQSRIICWVADCNGII